MIEWIREVTAVIDAARVDKDRSIEEISCDGEGRWAATACTPRTLLLAFEKQARSSTYILSWEVLGEWAIVGRSSTR